MSPRDPQTTAAAAVLTSQENRNRKRPQNRTAPEQQQQQQPQQQQQQQQSAKNPKRRRKSEDQENMGQVQFAYASLKDSHHHHHQDAGYHGDPIALAAETRAAREHMMCADCDLTLVVKGHRFSAHKSKLMEQSLYFRLDTVRLIAPAA